MSYTTGEAALLTLIRTIPGYDTKNTSRANWLILNNGKSDHYVILRAGQFTLPRLTFRAYLANYTTIIEIWQKYDTDTESKTKLYARLDEIITGLHTYPHLGEGANSSIIEAFLQGAPEPQEMWAGGGGPKWIRYELTMLFKENVCVTFSE